MLMSTSDEWMLGKLRNCQSFGRVFVKAACDEV